MGNWSARISKNITAALLLSLAAAQAAELLVAAASDLAPLEAAIRQACPAGVRFSFGSSGSLLRQIENGAPFDVYLSASEEFVKNGIAKGVLTGPAQVYAHGRIALWSRDSSITSLNQLTQAKILHIAIANPATAPYGAAAKQALERARLWSSLQPRIVFGENIRQTLQFAESGNADAAIVAWTLVHDRGGTLLPESLHQPINQAGAMVAATKQPQVARAFLEWLGSATAQSLFRTHGLQ